MKFDDFNWEDIIIEAPTEEVVEDEELTASDYTADEDLNIERYPELIYKPFAVNLIPNEGEDRHVKNN